MCMIDITDKSEVYREATAEGKIQLRKETVRLIKERKIEKGDPLYTAEIAGILAAKNTSSIIPLCHPIPVTSVKLDAKIVNESNVAVQATVKTKAQTGVEMEALLATAVALLTIWDMTKMYEKDRQGQYPYTCIRDIQVLQKTKGTE